ncbi:MAG: 6-phosphofructokinase [Chitinophagaceae bacterium]
MATIKKIGIMTSGGDSPGMNAAIRAVVRTAIHHQMTPYGIMRGYQGMIQGEIKKMKTTDVSNIIHRGGTILKTARSKDFLTPEGRKIAYNNIKEHDIDALVLIGGDGTFRGATQFFKEYDIPAVGLPGTIDNDLSGTDFTIGFDTAVNTAIQAIDKIRDTADAHDRIFLVEVMGRDAGYIALYSGISCGAEHIFIPEKKEQLERIISDIKNDQRRKKLTNIIVVAEGDEFGGANELSQLLKNEISNIDTRVTILGHVQRGGAPTCNDRILASRLGYHAILSLLEGKTQIMLGIVNNKIHYTPFDLCSKEAKNIDEHFFNLTEVLTK